MKIHLPFLIAILLAAALPVAGQGDVEQTPPQNPGIQLPAPKQSPPAQKQPKKPQQPAGKEPWPRSFIPSERINADSVVSFPADI